MGVAVVTGGSRGLGLQCARRLAAAAAELGAHFRVVDLEDQAATRAVLSEILATFGAPEILMLAHGVMALADC